MIMIRSMLLAAVLAAFFLMLSPSKEAFTQVPFSGGTATGTGYPTSATPVTASASGTGAVTATLPAAVGRTTWICGFTMTNAPGTSATGTSANATISGTIGGTLNFAYNSVTTGQGLLGVAFPICIPGSAANTAIVVSQPAPGTVQTTAVTAWGYQL